MNGKNLCNNIKHNQIRHENTKLGTKLTSRHQKNTLKKFTKFEIEVVGLIKVWILMLLYWIHLVRIDGFLRKKHMTTKGNNIMARGKSLVHIITNEVNVPKVMVKVHYIQLIMNNKMDNDILINKRNNNTKGHKLKTWKQ